MTTRTVPGRRRPPRSARRRRALPGALPGALPTAGLLLALAPVAFAFGSVRFPAPSPLPVPVELVSLEVAGLDGPKPLTPAFAPGIRHYAVRCAERETLTVTARPADRTAAGEPPKITLNGDPLAGGRAEVSLRHDQDLAVGVRRGAESTTYAIHCVPLDFPEVTVLTRRPGRAEGLLLLDPTHEVGSAKGKFVTYLAVLDDYGVPRFHRRIESRVVNFRWHAAQRRYSYTRALDEESCGNANTETVLLDERLEVVARVRAAGLCSTDGHDFLLTDEGNYLFIAYVPAVRDFSAVPDRDSGYPYSTEPTHDSVIQEVTPEGEVVFQWNSGEARDGTGPALKFADCRVNRFPDHYAWLNSFSLTSAGTLLASFRGCAQVLEIERPSGRVLRQLGGSAPALPDGRVHYRLVGDPEPAGFCGQHTPVETGRGANGEMRIALFDNGVHCPGDEHPDDNHRRRPREHHRSRLVEYRLGDGGEAVFLRHYEMPWFVPYAGSVQALGNGNRLLTYGRARGLSSTLVEVDPSGQEVLVVRIGGDRRERLYRAYREPGLTIPLNLP